jgi:hypothetical protein
MEDERNRLNSQPELIHAHRTATERRFWDKIATEQLLQKSQPPTEFPTFAVQPHDAEAYRRAMLQLKAAQKEVKGLAARNLGTSNFRHFILEIQLVWKRSDFTILCRGRVKTE